MSIGEVGWMVGPTLSKMLTYLYWKRVRIARARMRKNQAVEKTLPRLCTQGKVREIHEKAFTNQTGK